ncbi:6211_t:CDS:1, partial [Acaulospora morrowiae]
GNGKNLTQQFLSLCEQRKAFREEHEEYIKINPSINKYYNDSIINLEYFL